MARWCRRNRTFATTAAAVTLVSLLAAVTIAFVVRGAHAVERASRQETQIAHANAIQRLAQTREAADSWLIDLSGALQFYPGLQPIRQKLIDDAIRQYETLLKSAQAHDTGVEQGDPSDPLWRDRLRLQHHQLLECIQCNCRLGDLHRLSGKESLAQMYYETARHESVQLMDVHANSVVQSADFEHRIRCEQVNALVGRLLNSANETSIAIVLTHQDQLQHWLATHHPDNPSSDESRLWYKTASCLSRLAFAAAHYDVAAAWAERLFEHRSSDADARWVQTVAMRRAEGYESEGNLVQCGNVWRALVGHLTTLSQKYPDRVDYRQSLANARLQLADNLLGSNQGTDLSEIYDAALNDLNASIKLANADEFCIANLARAELGLGRSLSADTESRDLSEAHLRKAVALYGQMLQSEVSAPTLRDFVDAHLFLIDLKPALTNEEMVPLIQTAKTALSMLDDHKMATEQDRLNLEKLHRLSETQTNMDTAVGH